LYIDFVIRRGQPYSEFHEGDADGFARGKRILHSRTLMFGDGKSFDSGAHPVVLDCPCQRGEH